jgi:hypothetical protein
MSIKLWSVVGMEAAAVAGLRLALLLAALFALAPVPGLVLAAELLVAPPSSRWSKPSWPMSAGGRAASCS